MSPTTNTTRTIPPYYWSSRTSQLIKQIDPTPTLQEEKGKKDTSVANEDTQTYISPSHTDLWLATIESNNPLAALRNRPIRNPKNETN